MQYGWLATWRSHDAHGELTHVAFGLDVLTGGCASSGANSPCRPCWKALSGRNGRAKGIRVAAVYFNPRMVCNSERDRHADTRARRFQMSSQHSC